MTNDRWKLSPFRRRVTEGSLALLLCLGAGGSSPLSISQEKAQPQEQKQEEKKGQEPFKIGVEVNLVTVPVTVRKPAGGFVKGLPQSSFQILEDGEPQEILYFALWDAIWLVCTEVFKGVQEKKAMIIMSDGLDNDSSVGYSGMLDAAVRSEAMIYVVSKTESVRRSILFNMAQQRIYEGIPHEVFAEADAALRKIAYETGGRVLYPNNFGQLDNIYAEVDEELRSQYTLGYVSSNKIKDGSYRRIQARVAQSGVVVSARPGYYAPNDLPHSRLQE